MASAAAGIIGMQDQNEVCAVGVAPRSTLGCKKLNIYLQEFRHKT